MPAEEAKSKKVIDVYPLSKGRRVLAYLADFFISFILGLALFHLAAYPLSRVITNADEQANALIACQQDRDSTLYGNNLLFYGQGSDKKPASFSTNLEYTCKQYLCDYLVQPQGTEHDVYRHFFLDIRVKNASTWLSFCKQNDEKTFFFDFTETTMSLKEVYVEEFHPLLDEKDELSEKGKTDYTTFQEKYFLKAYSAMLVDIGTNDLTYNGISYKASQDKVAAILSQQQNVVLWCSLSAEIASLVICFFVVPMVSRYRKTAGMMALRIQRVNADTLRLTGRKEVFPFWVYQVAVNFAGVFFLPLPVFGFNELFTLTVPMFLSIASLVVVLASGLFVLIHSFNRSLLDVATNSILITNDQLDEVYHAKGYDY